MFGSASIGAHLLRGVVGLGALWGAATLLALHPGWAFALLALGLVALRGCPTCWTLGLIQVVYAKIRGRAVDASCVDGSCARLSPRAP